jgi:hypothetical protein
MNCVPAENRGTVGGTASTTRNTGMVASIAAFFAIIIVFLSKDLPSAFNSALTQAGVPSQSLHYFTSISPTQSLFAAFLGYNPMQSIVNGLPQNVRATISENSINTLTGLHWFPQAMAGAFMSSIQVAFFISALLCCVAAVASALRGKRYVHESATVASETS